jgi:hypothetical protein
MDEAQLHQVIDGYVQASMKVIMKPYEWTVKFITIVVIVICGAAVGAVVAGTIYVNSVNASLALRESGNETARVFDVCALVQTCEVKT